MPDIEDYGREVKKKNNLLDVKSATWIKTKYITSTPPPRFIEIPGK